MSAWFLEIAFVCNVDMYVCVHVSVPTPEAINYVHVHSCDIALVQPAEQVCISIKISTLFFKLTVVKTHINF